MKRMTVCAALLLALGSTAVVAQDAPRSKTFASDKVRNALDALLPMGVQVEDLHVDGAVVKFSGMSSDTVQLSQFMRRIDEAAEFEMPQLESVANVDGMSQFTLIAEMKCPSTADEPPSTLCGAAPATKAQTVYKCRINGTVTFQGQPCPAGSEG